MNRQQAKSQGLKSYPPEGPCKRGHISNRLVANNACLECERIRKRETPRTERTRANDRARQLRWRKNNPESYFRSLQRTNSWREENPDKARKSRERCKFKALGIKEAFENPANNCQICGKTKEKNGKELAFDHCHLTGKFRGWLCSNCNRAIGMLGDNFDSLYKAAQYLANFEFKHNNGEH